MHVIQRRKEAVALAAENADVFEEGAWQVVASNVKAMDVGVATVVSEMGLSQEFAQGMELGAPDQFPAGLEYLSMSKITSVRQLWYDLGAGPTLVELLSRLDMMEPGAVEAARVEVGVNCGGAPCFFLVGTGGQLLTDYLDVDHLHVELGCPCGGECRRSEATWSAGFCHLSLVPAEEVARVSREYGPFPVIRDVLPRFSERLLTEHTVSLIGDCVHVKEGATVASGAVLAELESYRIGAGRNRDSDGESVDSSVYLAAAEMGVRKPTSAYRTASGGPEQPMTMPRVHTCKFLFCEACNEVGSYQSMGGAKCCGSHEFQGKGDGRLFRADDAVFFLDCTGKKIANCPFSGKDAQGEMNIVAGRCLQYGGAVAVAIPPGVSFSVGGASFSPTTERHVVAAKYGLSVQFHSACRVTVRTMSGLGFVRLTHKAGLNFLYRHTYSKFTTAMSIQYHVVRGYKLNRCARDGYTKSQSEVEPSSDQWTVYRDTLENPAKSARLYHKANALYCKGFLELWGHIGVQGMLIGLGFYPATPVVRSAARITNFRMGDVDVFDSDSDCFDCMSDIGSDW